MIEIRQTRSKMQISENNLVAKDGWESSGDLDSKCLSMLSEEFME